MYKHGQSRDQDFTSNAVTQTVLGGLTTDPSVANFL